jgi:hypothetical protein
MSSFELAPLSGHVYGIDWEWSCVDWSDELKSVRVGGNCGDERGSFFLVEKRPVAMDGPTQNARCSRGDRRCVVGRLIIVAPCWQRPGHLLRSGESAGCLPLCSISADILSCSSSDACVRKTTVRRLRLREMCGVGLSWQTTFSVLISPWLASPDSLSSNDWQYTTLFCPLPPSGSFLSPRVLYSVFSVLWSMVSMYCTTFSHFHPIEIWTKNNTTFTLCLRAIFLQ